MIVDNYDGLLFRRCANTIQYIKNNITNSPH